MRFALQLTNNVGPDRVQQVTRAWQLAFNRAPSAAEQRDALNLLTSQVHHLNSVAEKAVEKPAEKKDEKKSKAAAKPAPEIQGLADLCQTLLSAKEFFYVD